MNKSSRVTRIALIAWALYLTIALSAFALHVHSPHESGVTKGGPPCALCIGHTVTGAVAVAAAFVLVAPMLLWRLQLWLARPQSALVAPLVCADKPRGPPAKVLFPVLN